MHNKIRLSSHWPRSRSHQRHTRCKPNANGKQIPIHFKQSNRTGGISEIQQMSLQSISVICRMCRDLFDIFVHITRHESGYGPSPSAFELRVFWQRRRKSQEILHLTRLFTDLQQRKASALIVPSIGSNDGRKIGVRRTINECQSFDVLTIRRAPTKMPRCIVYQTGKLSPKHRVNRITHFVVDCLLGPGYYSEVTQWMYGRDYGCGCRWEDKKRYVSCVS